jgi:hypothetical protein
MQPVSAGKSVSMPRIVIAVLIGSVLIGGIIAIGAQFVYPIIIFPIIMGAAAGILAMGTTLRLTKHGRLIGVLLAIASALVIYGSYRYCDYLLFLRKLNDPTIQVDFGQYLRLSAAVGETLQIRTMQVELGEALTWGHWAVELALVVGIAVLIPILPRTRQAMSKAAAASKSTVDGS